RVLREGSAESPAAGSKSERNGDIVGSDCQPAGSLNLHYHRIHGCARRGIGGLGCESELGADQRSARRHDIRPRHPKAKLINIFHAAGSAGGDNLAIVNRRGITAVHRCAVWRWSAPSAVSAAERINPKISLIVA